MKLKIKELKMILDSKNQESYNILIQELKNPYSNFYHEIARNEKDIGHIPHYVIFIMDYELVSIDSGIRKSCCLIGKYFFQLFRTVMTKCTALINRNMGSTKWVFIPGSM